jgi:hypothetical protein
MKPADAARTNLRLASIISIINAVLLAGFAFYWLVIPGVLMLWDLSDARWRKPAGIPRAVWRVHRALTPRYERYARERIASGIAAHLNLYDVPSTEWPMFGSVFYLAATEELQNEWDRDPSRSRQAPRDYARATIEACTDLVLDPVHHTWVKQHWGQNYLHTENVFFRAMIIQALTSRQHLLRDGKHLDILRDQVETLANDLDKSKHGVLHDYPGEVYPIDVFAAIACIRRADAVLGTDHSAFVARALRGFLPPYQDERGLVPYTIELPSGKPDGPSRGIGMSYVLIYAPELYPEQSRRWYALYEKHFWQQNWLASGWREYPRDLAGKDWLNDPDSGPVIKGFSPSGCAYGIGAARIAGRFDHAWTLASQALVAGWPLPDGSWLGARFLSAASAGHAPYLGEANLLFIYTRPTLPGTTITTGGHMSFLVWLGLGIAWGAGLLLLFLAYRLARRWVTGNQRVPAERVQFAIWLVLLASVTGCLAAGQTQPAMVALLAAQFLPRYRRT